MTVSHTCIDSSHWSLAYRVLFKRHVTSLQWLALVLLCLAIIVTKLSGDGEGIYVAPMAFLLAGSVSLLSVIAAVFMEVSLDLIYVSLVLYTSAWASYLAFRISL